MHYEKLKEFGVFQNTIVCAKSKIMFYFSKRAKSGVHNIYTCSIFYSESQKCACEKIMENFMRYK